MIIKIDAKALEWRAKSFLSQDEVAIQEILDGVDMHSVNQERFKLLSRLIAKIFNFRMIFADAYSEMGFARPAYAYSKDPEFNNSSVKYWTGVVEEFFNKYKGMYQHGLNLINEVNRTGKLVQITGREYEFSMVEHRGVREYPRTQILNYPVQGLSAELMAQARVTLRKRLMEKGYDLDRQVLLMNTVHDSIELDVDGTPETWYNICIELENVLLDLPRLFEKYYGVAFNVPLAGEVVFDYNMKGTCEGKRGLEMHSFKRANGPEQFYI